MAQRVHVVLVDDIDGSEADESVRFGLDGKDYSIDLTTKHAKQLRDALAPFVAHAETVSSQRRRSKSASSAGGNGASAAEVRTWARDNGYDVPDRGRVSAEVRQAFDAAH